MGGVRGDPTEIPCVRCGQVPTVGFAYGGTEATTGRICVEHGGEASEAGVPVAADVGGGRNWEAR